MQGIKRQHNKQSDKDRYIINVLKNLCLTQTQINYTLLNQIIPNTTKEEINKAVAKTSALKITQTGENIHITIHKPSLEESLLVYLNQQEHPQHITTIEEKLQTKIPTNKIDYILKKRRILRYDKNTYGTHKHSKLSEEQKTTIRALTLQKIKKDKKTTVTKICRYIQKKTEINYYEIRNFVIQTLTQNQ